VCCVLSGRGLCDELITRPEEPYRPWRVVVCDQEPRERGDYSPRWAAEPEIIIIIIIRFEQIYCSSLGGTILYIQYLLMMNNKPARNMERLLIEIN
jgi:hypothetical protein